MINISDLMAGSISSLKEKLSEEHPNHCKTCGGQAGSVSFGETEPHTHPCSDCYLKGLDPLDTTKALQGKVSPSTDCDLLNPKRDFNLLTDMIASLEGSLYGRDCVEGVSFSSFFNPDIY